MIVQVFTGCDRVVLDNAEHLIQNTVQEKKMSGVTACNFCDPTWWGWTCYMCGKVGAANNARTYCAMLQHRKIPPIL